MFYKKTKLLREKEEELNFLRTTLKEKDNSILLLDVELKNINSENQVLNQKIKELNLKYSVYIEHDKSFEKEKATLEELQNQELSLTRNIKMV